MQAFTTVTGRAAPLLRANIDTDVIIRIERLVPENRDKIGQFTFEALRYLPDGTDDAGFVLNDPQYRGAPILIAGRNFGCGSSREGAVWALQALGLTCVIAESFGDIFYANCFQNGMLPIRLSEADVAALAVDAVSSGGAFTVDLHAQRIFAPGGREFPFMTEPLRRTALLKGLDDLGLTLLQSDEIGAWQAGDRAARPWVWQLGSPELTPHVSPLSSSNVP